MDCFLILHYNEPEVTCACVSSILELEGRERIRIVVVDNASPDGSGRMLAETYGNNDKVSVLRLPGNKGFSAGNNAGYKFAIKTFDIDFLIVCNNDTLFEQKDILTRIRRIYGEENFDILGPDILVPGEGVHQNPLAADPPDRKGVQRTILLNGISILLYPLLYPLIRGYIQKQGAKRDRKRRFQKKQMNVCLLGSCLIYSRKYLSGRSKLFDPETYFYYEEFIQTLQCRREGKKILYSPDIQVLHLNGRSTDSDHREERDKTLFMMRNMLSAAKTYRKLL